MAEHCLQLHIYSKEVTSSHVNFGEQKLQSISKFLGKAETKMQIWQ